MSLTALETLADLNQPSGFDVIMWGFAASLRLAAKLFVCHHARTGCSSDDEPLRGWNVFSIFHSQWVLLCSDANSVAAV